jgi:hypothetical protein
MQVAMGFVIQCLPALVALVAWGEAGHRLLKQFGARMLWELAGLAVVAVGFLLYTTAQFDVDDGTNLTAIVVASLCTVLVVTGIVHGFPHMPKSWRPIVSFGAALVVLPVGAVLGVFLHALVS